MSEKKAVMFNVQTLNITEHFITEYEIGILRISITVDLIKPFSGGHVVISVLEKGKTEICESKSIQDVIERKTKWHLNKNEMDWVLEVNEMIINLSEHDIQLFYLKPNDFMTVMSPKNEDYVLKK